MLRHVALFLIILLGACVRPSSDETVVTTLQPTSASIQRERAQQILRTIQAAETRSVLVSMTSFTRGRPDLTPVARQFAEYTSTGYVDNRSLAAGLMIFEITDVGGVRGRVSGGSIKETGPSFEAETLRYSSPEADINSLSSILTDQSSALRDKAHFRSAVDRHLNGCSWV
jgi:hypothetical protein